VAKITTLENNNLKKIIRFKKKTPPVLFESPKKKDSQDEKLQSISFLKPFSEKKRTPDEYNTN
jgi:hypothetical protein